jgi:hypothetical protein
VRVWSSLWWHTAHTTFNENPFSNSGVIIW